eukprot:gb/GECH01014719.1/.p1 GENE.gb/GECH01014719.1/~~gb/GECH01014719.1/.p1  ORF type:complete len:224 (+),score=73.22 gb/GECH01014719.1/:1-672(+)
MFSRSNYQDSKKTSKNAYYPPSREKRRKSGVNESSTKGRKSSSSLTKKELFNKTPARKRSTKSLSDESAPKEGFEVTREEVSQAFAFLNPTGRKSLRPKDLKDRLSAFYPNMSSKEYRFLVDQSHFTEDTLYDLLRDNDVTDFDPVAEAFKVYDPHETGYMNEDILKGVMESLGYGKLPPEEIQILKNVADVDGDGKVSLEDFRSMIYHQSDEEKENNNKKQK